MLDAVSAHTDCLIQIVKERRSFGCCGSGILLNRLRVKPYFQGFSEVIRPVFALPLALSMEAHYRELKLSGKGNFAHVNSHFQPNRSNQPTRVNALTGFRMQAFLRLAGSKEVSRSRLYRLFFRTIS